MATVISNSEFLKKLKEHADYKGGNKLFKYQIGKASITINSSDDLQVSFDYEAPEVCVYIFQGYPLTMNFPKNDKSFITLRGLNIQGRNCVCQPNKSTAVSIKF